MAVEPRIGIDLGGTKIEGIVLSGDGRLREQLRIDTPRNDYPATLAAVVTLCRRLDPSGKLKVGIGAPGSWVASRGRMQNCNSTWLNDRPLLSDLIEALGPRVRLANDADCFVLSEATDGSAVGAGVVFGVILGTGVGGGLVVDGRLVSGPNGLTGEWGHTPLPYLDAGEAGSAAPRRCYCDRLDCVETYLSGPGLLATHRALWPEEAEPPGSGLEVYRRAREAGLAAGWMDSDEGGGEPARARAALGVYCRMLARSLAQLVNMLDPHTIVLGGGLSQMLEIYEPVRALMAASVFGDVFETRLTPPRWGDASGVRGAADLWPPGS